MMLTYKSTYGVPVGLSGEPKAVPLRLSGKPGVFLDRGSTPTAPLEARRAVNSHWQRWLDATALRPDLERVRPDCDHEHQGAEHQEGPGSTSGLHVGTGWQLPALPQCYRSSLPRARGRVLVRLQRRMPADGFHSPRRARR